LLPTFVAFFPFKPWSESILGFYKKVWIWILEKEWEPDPDVEKSLDPDSDLISLDPPHWKLQMSVWLANLATVFIMVS
jgi:hypothetical protein